MERMMTEMGQEIVQGVSRTVRKKVERVHRRKKRGNTVMTRLSDEDLKHIDILVGVGLYKSRSEAVVYLTHERIAAKEGVFQQLTEKLDEIKNIRDKARALIGS
jgi:Arc/MetJ-type ribon-helix-helix transcriptional regulator